MIVTIQVFPELVEGSTGLRQAQASTSCIVTLTINKAAVFYSPGTTYVERYYRMLYQGIFISF